MPLVQSWGILAYKNLWETFRENRREFGNVSGDYKINQQKAKVHTHTHNWLEEMIKDLNLCSQKDIKLSRNGHNLQK